MQKKKKGDKEGGGDDERDVGYVNREKRDIH